MKLSQEELEEKALVLHRRKPSKCVCAVCGRDCRTPVALRNHRVACPKKETDYTRTVDGKDED